MIHWGGVSLHTGLQRSKFSASLLKEFDDVDVDTGGNTATITDTVATFDINSEVTSIPIEVSTSIRMLWALTMYGGAGFDLVSGSTEVDLEATGQGTGTGYTTNISATENGDGDADATNFRAFAGLQLNIPFVRVYTHINKGLGNDLIGANAGIKILY